MYNICVRCNYKQTLWFKNKVWNKNIKLSTKTTNLIKACTNLKKASKIDNFFLKKHKFESSEMPLVGIKF